MSSEKELKEEIKEMEKLAEDFVDNRFVRCGRKCLGIDAIQDCSNFTLEYNRKIAKLNILQKRNIEIEQAVVEKKFKNKSWCNEDLIIASEFLQKLGLGDK